MRYSSYLGLHVYAEFGSDDQLNNRHKLGWFWHRNYMNKEMEEPECVR